MVLVILSTKIIIDEKENTSCFEKYTLKENTNKKYKEYCFTYLNESINNNVIPLGKTQVKNYFTDYGDKAIVSFEKSYIKYSKDKDCFCLMYYNDESSTREDDYKYDIINGKIKYTFYNTIYINGRL